MKSYDLAYGTYSIRNIYPEIIDEHLAYSLGQALGKWLLENHGPDASLVFAGDGRQANNTLIFAFLCGLEQVGFDRYSNGGVPVPCVVGQSLTRGVCSSASLYYFTKDAFDLGVMFTASHNPPEYAGIKIIRKDALFVPTTWLKELVTHYEEFDTESRQQRFDIIWGKAHKGNAQLADVVSQRRKGLQELLIERFSSLTKQFRIVVDFTNGGAIADEKMVFDTLHHDKQSEYIYLNQLADSNFTAHLGDTTDPVNYIQLVQAVKNEQADLGIIFDGDADRLGLVDEQGQYIGGDVLVALIAKYLLEKHGPSKSVVYDVSCSNTVPELIRSLGGIPVPSRIGMVFLKELFYDHQAIFGGELSGHIFFPESSGCESPMLALYYLLALLEKYPEHTLSSLVNTIHHYYKLPLINYTTQHKFTIIERVSEYFKQYPQDRTDGVRIDGDGWWLLVRASNTEPILRLYIEANTQDIREAKFSEVESIFGEDCIPFAHH